MMLEYLTRVEGEINNYAVKRLKTILPELELLAFFVLCGI